MGPLELARILLVAGFLATLVAGMLWMRAWRGRIIGWKSCCNRCGFELRGLNPAVSACPECGSGLASAAALRPAARQNEPWRWWLAVTATSLGMLALWLGDARQVRLAGRWICSLMPTPLLVSSLDLMPSFASIELRARAESNAIGVAQVPDVAHRLAAAAAANPRMVPQDAAEALAALRLRGQLDASTLHDALATALSGVKPLGGQPNACKPSGTFAIGVSLPPGQPTAWITRGELRLAIAEARVRMPDGAWQPLQSASPADRPAWQFDAVALRAPDTQGTYDCEMRVAMQQPGGGFRSETVVPFRLTVIDPSQIKLDFKPDAALATRVRQWLEQGSVELDVDPSKLRPALPGDPRTIEPGSLAVAGRLQVVQDAVVIDVGRVWIDATSPTVVLLAATMPGPLDRSRGAFLRLQPDLEVALSMASSSIGVLRDMVQVPVRLPAPPSAPTGTASASDAPAPSTP